MTSSTQSELVFAPAHAQAAAIARREVGCVELLDAHLTRVQRYNPIVNALCVLDADRARALAKHADDLPIHSAARCAPLFGVPMTVKESFDVVGLPTTWGLVEHQHNVASADAVAVARLKSAGAVVFGKSNVPAWLADWQTFNPLYGTTNNPWRTGCTPGGSSGGAAAALAAGLSALELGSDIGASIRNPAHYCGVYGHKPTYGICPMAGHALPGAVANADIAVIGPLARSAKDLATALAIIAGAARDDALGWTLALPREAARTPRDWRVGVLASHPTAEVDQTVSGAIEQLADFLRRAGVTITDNAQPEFDLDEAHKVYITLLRAATSGQASAEKFDELRRIAPTLDPADQSYFAQHVRANTTTHRDWLAANNRRHQMRLAWQRFFEQFDVLLCPAAATTAFEHNQRGERWQRMIDVNGRQQPTTTQLFWAGLSGMAYLPSTVAPIGRSPDGLPIGVQIVAPAYFDYRAIAFADLLEREYYRFTPPAQFNERLIRSPQSSALGRA